MPLIQTLAQPAPAEQAPSVQIHPLDVAISDAKGEAPGWFRRVSNSDLKNLFLLLDTLGAVPNDRSLALKHEAILKGFLWKDSETHEVCKKLCTVAIAHAVPCSNDANRLAACQVILSGAWYQGRRDNLIEMAKRYLDAGYGRLGDDDTDPYEACATTDRGADFTPPQSNLLERAMCAGSWDFCMLLVERGMSLATPMRDSTGAWDSVAKALVEKGEHREPTLHDLLHYQLRARPTDLSRFVQADMRNAIERERSSIGIATPISAAPSTRRSPL